MSALTETKPQAPAQRLKGLISQEAIRSRFEEVLGKRAAGFMSSIVSAVTTNKALQNCEPMSVISSAMIAASMDLPINPSLGFAHIVPYKDVAQFQIGWKGIIQLALRSGQYKTINLVPIKEGQIKSKNSFTGEFEFQEDALSEKQIGYLLYFKLINGYEKFFYMTREEVEAHGKRYSQSFKKGFGQWVDNFEAMALKTVAKMGLSKYGVLSIEMQKAIEFDQGVVTAPDAPPVFPDAPKEELPPAPKETSSRLVAAISNDEPKKESAPI